MMIEMHQNVAFHPLLPIPPRKVFRYLRKEFLWGYKVRVISYFFKETIPFLTAPVNLMAYVHKETNITSR